MDAIVPENRIPFCGTKPRFYDVTEGSITIDGQDIRDLTIESVRQNIGFVPQKGILFS